MRHHLIDAVLDDLDGKTAGWASGRLTITIEEANAWAAKLREYRAWAEECRAASIRFNEENAALERQLREGAPASSDATTAIHALRDVALAMIRLPGINDGR